MSSQMSLFDGQHKFVIDKPIRLIELFAGYGSQALALKYLGVPFSHWKVSEWAHKSIQAYKDLHFTEESKDYSENLSLEEIFDFLYKFGVSSNYNEPMTYEQIKRLGEKVRAIYNNIVITHNVGSVCNIHAEDLEIRDTERFCYIMTYSFPCQDLSSAGKGLGMEKGGGTRSGLLWEVERLLRECKELPQVLLMENVPEVIGSKNIKHFANWIAFLDSLGYKSKWEVLNATGFNVPQNRERCFMVSVLGDYYYEFPHESGCTKRLKDVLQENVDESYYLSNAIIEYFFKHTEEAKENGNGFRFTPTDGDCIGRTIKTRAGSRMDDNYIDEDALGVRVGMSKDFSRAPLQGVSRAIMTDGREAVIEVEEQKDYRIRKLTEKECFRLMGVKDEDFEKVAKNQSKSSMYHLAGDSIVVDVLMAIFKQML